MPCSEETLGLLYSEQRFRIWMKIEQLWPAQELIANNCANTAVNKICRPSLSPRDGIEKMVVELMSFKFFRRVPGLDVAMWTPEQNRSVEVEAGVGRSCNTCN